MSAAVAEPMKRSPSYAVYTRLAPRVVDWPVLVGKVAELKQQDSDWTSEVAAIKAPVLLVFADADAVRPAHAREFFAPFYGGPGAVTDLLRPLVRAEHGANPLADTHIEVI
ncbi:hypothetical protein [Streptomyces albospinus]|nr:hypothetical protein [Streptomyces albospinus]